MNRKYLMVVLGIFFITIVLFFNEKNYKEPSQKDILKRFNYIENEIRKPFDSTSSFMKIQRYTPEWSLFSITFSALACENLLNKNIITKDRASNFMESATKLALSKQINSAWVDTLSEESIIRSNYSILYLGHINLILGLYYRITENNKYATLQNVISNNILQRMNKSKSTCLPSYGDEVWIPDNIVALVSLKYNSQNELINKKFISRWLANAKSKFCNKNQLLCSKIDILTGEITEDTRGSMLGWSIIFLEKIDPDFAKFQYFTFNKKYGSNFIFFSAFKEYANTLHTNKGDIDSGPVLFGYSIPSTVFAFCNAIKFQDFKVANKIKNLQKIGSIKRETEKFISYKTRFIDLEVTPLSESVLLFAETNQ